MTLLIVGLFQAVQVDVNAAHPFQFRLFPCVQAFNVAIAVPQVGQHIIIAEPLQILLLIALFRLFVMKNRIDESRVESCSC